MSRGYNWRNTLVNFASISAVLAGFCVAFIGLILKWSLEDIMIFEPLTFGNMAILLFGISTGLFVTASEYFLHSKNFDVFDLPEDYKDWLTRGLPNENWDNVWRQSSMKMLAEESRGRHCYNLAIFTMFGGLFFAIVPYNFLIATVVSAFGIILELSQF